MRRGPTFLLLVLLVNACAAAREPLRIACVGDSITYGDKLADRETQSYPAALARRAGGRAVVGNFGVNGATTLPDPFRAWLDTPAARAALAFDPGAVVIMLGINDLLNHADRLDRYPAALRDVVGRFQALPSAPRLFLCTLTPIAPPDAAAEANRIIRDVLNPAIRAVAAETGATVVDVSAAYPNRLDWLPDGLHPTPAGAERIAQTVWDALAPAAAPPQIQPAPAAGPVDLSIRNEALAALARAERWLGTHPAPDDLPAPDPAADVAEWLPLLDGAPPPAGTPLFRACDELAASLGRAGQTVVFLPDGRPVAWREALLHRLVLAQKIDARGDGYWRDPQAADPDADAARATAHALRALRRALGE